MHVISHCAGARGCSGAAGEGSPLASDELVPVVQVSVCPWAVAVTRTPYLGTELLGAGVSVYLLRWLGP